MKAQALINAIKKPSRKALFAIAAAFAVTGATGAAALLAPSDLGLGRIVSAATAQITNPTTVNDDVAQLPFDRVAQAPTTDETAPASTETAAAPEAAPAGEAPIAQGPRASGPVARTSVSAPQGHMVPTAAPGVITQKQQAQTKFFTETKFVAKTKHIVRPRAVYVAAEHCNE